MRKALAYLFLFIAGYGLAIFINFTFSFRDVLLTFWIAAGTYFIAGACFRLFRNIRPWLFLSPVIIHFTLISVLVRPIPYVPLLAAACVVMFMLGMVIRRMIQEKKYATGVLCLIAAAIASYYLLENVYRTWLFEQSVLPASQQEILEGIKLVTAEGDTLTSEDLSGKVLLMETWHLSCGICKKQFAAMDSLSRMYRADKDVIVLAVDHGAADTYKEFAAYMRDRKATQLIFVYDAGSVIAKRLHINASPYTMIIDRSGKMRFFLSGYGKQTSDGFIQRIDLELKKALGPNS